MRAANAAPISEAPGRVAVPAWPESANAPGAAFGRSSTPGASASPSTICSPGRARSPSRRAGLLAFGIVLTLWEVSGSVRAITGALNQIYDTGRDPRSVWRRFGTSVAIAVVIGCCFLGAVLVFTLAKHTGGSLETLLSVGRWIVALVLLGLAVNALVRFAPAEPRSERWVSVGSAFIVASWAVMSVIFRVYVTSVASFRSPWGTFVTILVLTAYINISAIVFLVGVQADELIRKDATPGEKGLFERVRAAFG